MVINKEFWPKDTDDPEAGGLMAIRPDNYAHTLEHFMELSKILVEDGLRAQPPVEITADAIDVEKYSGERFKGVFGLEFHLPAGHRPPEDYYVWGNGNVRISDWIPTAS